MFTHKENRMIKIRIQKYSNSKYPLLDHHYYSYKLKTSITDLNLHYLITHKSEHLSYEEKETLKLKITITIHK